jgi:7-carboxy-7-deazaguanine synthase
LRCQYCDTAYAFHGGTWFSIDEVLAEVARHDTRYVCVTGGEPLAQRACLTLLTQLCDQGYRVSLETSGALDVTSVDPRVVRVVDIKTPGSGESERNRLENLTDLRATDQLKFVICDRADYDWSRRFIAEHELVGRCPILLSPSHEQLQAVQLADWILADHAPVRMQIQLHKYLWGNVPGK